MDQPILFAVAGHVRQKSSGPSEEAQADRVRRIQGEEHFAGSAVDNHDLAKLVGADFSEQQFRDAISVQVSRGMGMSSDVAATGGSDRIEWFQSASVIHIDAAVAHHVELADTISREVRKPAEIPAKAFSGLCVG